MKNRPKPIPNERGEGQYELINEGEITFCLLTCAIVDRLTK